MWLVEQQVLAIGQHSSRQKLAFAPRADFSFEQHLSTLELAVSDFLGPLPFEQLVRLLDPLEEAGVYLLMKATFYFELLDHS